MQVIVKTKFCQKNFYYTETLYFKTVLYKFIWTRSKNRVIENRVMENRVKRGITVPELQEHFLLLIKIDA